jgi:hypothetical protein
MHSQLQISDVIMYLIWFLERRAKQLKIILN